MSDFYFNTEENSENLEEIIDLCSFINLCYLNTDIINFDQKNNKNTLVEFLENDDIIIYSLIISTNDKKIKDFVLNNILYLKNAKNIILENDNIFHIFSIIYEFLILIKYWYKNLSNENIIKDNIEHSLDETVFYIKTLIDEIKKLQINTEKINNIIYKINIALSKKPYSTTTTNIDLNEKNFNNDKSTIYDFCYDIIRNILESFIKKISDLKSLAIKNFFNVLYNQNHNPHITLLITFFKELSNVKKSIFNFSTRIKDYYYKGILMYENKPEKKDETIVMFYKQNDKDTNFIGQNTELYGGKDEKNNDIIFETTKNLKINSMNIKTIRTISKISNKIDKKETSLYKSYKIAEYNMEEIYNNNQLLNLFSTKKGNDIHLLDTKNNTLGNILSSKIFKLTEGLRKIKIKFFLSDKLVTAIVNYLKNYNIINNNKIESIKKYTELLKDSLTIKFTSSAGLIEIDNSNINISFDEKNTSIDIDMLLSYEIPGIDICKDFCIKDIPSILFLANDKTTLWAFLLFINLKYDKIKIIVNVEKCNNITVQNDLGISNNSMSYQLFGPSPQVNSAVYIACDEIFNKKISELKIKLKWSELPEDNFETHYQDYNKDIETSSFKVKISFLKNKEWVPINENDRQKLNLFELDENKKIKKETVLNINIEKLGINLKNQFEYETQHLSANTIGGFLKIELVEPIFAFGHKLYSEILTKKILSKKNILLKIFSPIDLKMPYTPTVEKITIDYTSEINIYNNNEQDFKINRIHPFGYFNIDAIKADIQANNTLTKEDLSYSDKTTLFIEITNISSPTINLYFALDETTSKIRKNKLNTKIGYIINNKCIFFKEHEIILDETNGFTKSGTIKIKLPKINTGINTYQQSKYDKSLWIVIYFLEDRDSLPTILGIYYNCVKAIRTSINNNLSLPQNSLKSIHNNKNININILQPFRSYGGCKKETDDEMFIRIKNRLQSKGRCITSEDYTNFILENFKEVKSIKIIQNNNKYTPENNIQTKNTTILVILNKKEYMGNNIKFPEASPELLNAIKNKLESCCSPFVNLNIINPSYEKLKVMIRVNFKNIADENLLKEQLNKDISYFISPWLIKTEININISSSFSVIDLVKFIKSKPYINIIENLYVLKICENKIQYTYRFNDIIYPENDHSIFYSEDNHTIISDDLSKNIKSDINIENARINEDMIIGAEKLENSNNNTHLPDNIETEETSNDYFLMFNKT